MLKNDTLQNGTPVLVYMEVFPPSRMHINQLTVPGVSNKCIFTSEDLNEANIVFIALLKRVTIV